MSQTKTIKWFKLSILRNAVLSWFEPQSKERDEAFRERVLRAALAIIIVLGMLSFVSGLLIYHDPWSLVSFPSLHVVALGLCFASMFALLKGYLRAAGWALVLTVIVGASGVILLLRQRGALVGFNETLAVFYFVPLVGALVLTRNAIFYATLLSIAAFAFSRYLFPIGPLAQVEAAAWPQLTSSFLLLLMEGMLLRQLRVEFDARLETMSRLINETEYAKQQSEEARLQAEEARKRAELADKAKSQFLANMSHELRTPLNAIIGFDEVMLAGMAGTFTPKQTELLRHIQKNGRRLLGVINDILDLSKIESGALEIYLSPIYPSILTNEIVESLQSLAGDKDVHLSITIAENTPQIILGDGKKLEQILTNLIGNAIKFTEKGNVLVTVQATDNSTWQFSVKDSGIGIPEDSIAKIFDPFKQLDSGASRKYKGTGLGLAITKRLVEAMGGNITVESELEKGSTFTVALPYTTPS